MESARKALLDTLEALEIHLDALVLVGAQAVYLHTTDFDSEVAPATFDADFAIDVASLQTKPDIEFILTDNDFIYAENGNPGQWLSPEGIPVDIMVPKKISGRPGNGRSARLEGHANKSVRVTEGLEGCVVSNSMMEIASLVPGDSRKFNLKVANPSSIIIAKSFKIAEHLRANRRIENKDSFDIFRLLAHVPIQNLVAQFEVLISNDLSRETTLKGLKYFENLFTANVDAPGILAIGASVQGLGNVQIRKASAFTLSKELLNAISNLIS